jgi:MtN3 and saliva related transmembrane protein
MNVNTVEIIGLIAGIITSMGFLPQLFKSYKTKKLDDVSYFMPAVLSLGMGIWFVYGYLTNSISVMAANSFGILCCICLIFMKNIYK